MSVWILVAVLGALAGALTTIAGMGGGLLLLIALSLLWDPATALACTTPALLVGNLHRVLLLRRVVGWPIARRFAAGALPGGVAGALFAASVPPAVVAAFMVVTTLLAVLRALLVPRLAVRPSWMAPAGFGIGVLTATAGGAGVLASPLLLSAGLAGEAYVGTSAACAVVLHVARIVGYGASGLFAGQTLGHAALLAVAILAGNLIGRSAERVTRLWPRGLVEHVVLGVSMVLAVVGLVR